MTLIIAMKARDSIIMASDGRVLMGNSNYRDNETKLFCLKNLMVGIFGYGEIGAFLLQHHWKELLDKSDSIDDCAELINKKFSKTYNTSLNGSAAGEKPIVGFILAGYRGGKAGPEQEIYSFRSKSNFSPEISGNEPIFGGIAQYGWYISPKFYLPNISAAKAKFLSAYIIKETSDRDFLVGGKINIFEIIAGGPAKQINDTELATILMGIELFNRDIIQLFNNLKISPMPQT